MSFIRFTIILLFTLAFTITAQTDSIEVDPAPSGLYIYISNQSLSKDTPLDNGAVKARLLRKPIEENEYSEVNIIQRAEDADEFFEIVGKSSGSFENESEKDSAWNYIRNNPEIQEYGLTLLNPRFMEAMGAAYLDKEVSKGNRYQYKVEYLNANDKIVNTAFSKPTGLDKKPNITKPHFDKIFETDTSATIFWKADENENGEAFFADIYIQTNGKGEFNKLNDLAVKTRTDTGMIYQVRFSNLTKGALYRAYIEPYNFLNVKGPSSDTVSFYAVNYNQIQLVNSANAKDTTTGIYLTWGKLPQKPYYRGVEIQKTSNVLEGYNTLDTMGISDTSYLDNRVKPNQTYYYRFRPVVNKNTDLPFQVSARSEFTGSIFKPMPPSSVTASKEDNKIKLNWNAPEDTLIYAYNIYRGNNFSDSLNILRSNFKETSFIDSSQALKNGGSFVYAVTSVNENNKESVYSNKVSVRITSRIKPQPPAGISGYEEKSRIRLIWNGVNNNGYVVEGYNIYRKSKSENDFKKLNQELVTSNFYDDNTAKKGVKYEYSITTVTSAGNESNLSTSSSFKIGKTALFPPRSLKTQSVNKGIKLSWSRVIDERITGYRVYRRDINSNSFELVGKLKNNTSKFVDRNVQKGKIYTYSVSTVSSSTESRKSTASSEKYDP